jgi:hypothetical protein
MALPSNRIVAVAALVVSLVAAVGSTRITAPWDIALVVATALLGAFALASFLASRAV